MSVPYWRRVFRRSDVISEGVENAIETQAAFERVHVAAYAPDQRLQALVQRYTLIVGSAPPKAALEMLTKAANDWAAATRSAEEVP